MPRGGGRGVVAGRLEKWSARRPSPWHSNAERTMSAGSAAIKCPFRRALAASRTQSVLPGMTTMAKHCPHMRAAAELDGGAHRMARVVKMEDFGEQAAGTDAREPGWQTPRADVECHGTSSGARAGDRRPGPRSGGGWSE